MQQLEALADLESEHHDELSGPWQRHGLRAQLTIGMILPSFAAVAGQWAPRSQSAK